MSETVQKVIEEIVANRERFEEFCLSLSDDELSRPVPNSTWLVRDFIAHLDTLDPMLVSWLSAVADGNPPETTRDLDGRPFDVDAYNDAEVEARRDWPVRKVLDEARTNRAALIGVLERLTEEQVSQMMKFAGDAKRPPAEIPLKVFMAGWAQHDPIHVADMLRALPERADDPDLLKWLDNVYVKGYQHVMNR